MSLKSERVKKGYADLTETEKNEVKLFIRQHDEAGPYTQERMVANLNESKSLGPTSAGKCPCCGG